MTSFLSRSPEASAAETDTHRNDLDGPGRRRFLALGLGSILAAIPLTRSASAGAATKTTVKPKAKAKKKVTTKTVATKAPATKATAAAAPAVAGAPFPTGHEVAVAFSYVASGGGRIHNPYVVVWVEDASQNLVRTMSLNFQQGKGMRWLPDLFTWYDKEQSRVLVGGTSVVDTLSAPTKAPGAYRVVWDGKDENGQTVGQGAYTVVIEAARERGPHDIVSVPISIGAGPASAKAADTGDLQGISVELRARG
jgi:hypothetical protein